MSDFTPQNEMGVVTLFSQLQSLSGHTIVEIGITYPDAIVEKSGVVYRVEFEFRSQNFVIHGHDPRLCDLVVCWENNLECDDFPLPVLEMSNPDWYKSPFELASVYAINAFYWKGRALRAESALEREKARVESVALIQKKAIDREERLAKERARVEKAILRQEERLVKEKAKAELVGLTRKEEEKREKRERLAASPTERPAMYDSGLKDDSGYQKLPNEYPSQASRSYLRELYAEMGTKRGVLRAVWGGVVNESGKTPKTQRWLEEALTQELQN